MKKILSSDAFLVVLMVILFGLVDCFITTLYWQHEAVIHHGAFWESNNWGVTSFKWNDVSFAQTPFQDPAIYQAKMDEASNAKLKALGIQ